jgi:hypothetical protein
LTKGEIASGKPANGAMPRAALGGLCKSWLARIISTSYTNKVEEEKLVDANRGGNSCHINAVSKESHQRPVALGDSRIVTISLYNKVIGDQAGRGEDYQRARL